MKIRKARKEDTRKIHLLMKKTFEKINSKDYSNEAIKILNEKNSTDKIIKRIQEYNIFCLVENDKILGTIGLKGNIVGGLYIKWDMVGKGYGKKLMEFTENYAKKKGINKLILYPTITSQKFYKKLGYKRTGKNSTWKSKGKVIQLNVPEIYKDLK